MRAPLHFALFVLVAAGCGTSEEPSSAVGPSSAPVGGGGAPAPSSGRGGGAGVVAPPGAGMGAAAGTAGTPAVTATAGSGTAGSVAPEPPATGGAGGSDMAAAGGSGGGASAMGTPASCDGVEPKILNLTPAELSQMLVAKDFELINVHIPYAGQIESTDVHIAYTDIAALETRLQNDRATKAVLYCRSGSMSSTAATNLVAKGYCRIYDLPGGMNGWTAAGFSLMP